jgi:dolichol-phosphate mannosyltransferase
MKEVLVFTATYNEADNIASLVEEVFAALPRSEMLVVDDNSPDGTGRILDELAAKDARLHVIHRPSKNGLGTAHKLAVKYAVTHEFGALVTMDADFSHDPKMLPEMMRRLQDSEFVIGSRYVEGGSCAYPPSRVALSRTANTLTRALLGIPLHETTTSYRGFRRSLLERMNLDAIRSDGYSYFVESINQVARLAKNGAGMSEFPIQFADRRAGTTKISKKEIWKGFTTLGRLAAKRVASAVGFERTKPGFDKPQDLLPCNACGCTYHTEEYPASNEGHGSAAYRCTSTGHDSHGRIVRCLGCGLVYTNPQLTEKEVLELYSQVEDETYLENNKARVQTFSYNLDAIQQYLPAKGRLLDLGAYCGTFLEIARDRGYEIAGVEPSVWASAYAREKLGLPVITGHIRDVSRDKPFDAVCSWDVLEHVSDPMNELKLVNERLRMGGVFAFSTLDYGNWFPRLAGERWPWMMDMHIYYFDQKVMVQMLERAGFRMVHNRAYCHIITFEYFLRKLDALGVPAAAMLRGLVEKTPLANAFVPFRFGDIQLYVCEKVRNVEATESNETRARAAKSVPPAEMPRVTTFGAIPVGVS